VTRAAITARGVLGQVTRAFHYQDRHVFIQLYKQYVRPHLKFAAPAWSPWLVGDIKALEDVQIQAVKMVSGLKSKDYHERLAKLSMTTLEERRREMDIVQTFKIVNGIDKVNSQDWFTKAVNRGTRGTSGLGQAKIRARVQETFLQSESDRRLELTLRPREGGTECTVLQAPIQAHLADSRPRMMSGRWQDKRNGQHTIQTSSSWFYMGRRGLLSKYPSKYTIIH
jgi:hypothetical protein